ncbi:hypothetical protein [uncultured Flavobacterium sp.]|uniref:hypothetical protein n=1 Tax=uncultured Flavobacterium sp. TaxID=165435 RepID=UPI0030ECD3F0|tara:strand:- start:26 stop:1030 length:1005 start_codon:yes stop_codon:yes gene_type:complete
MKLEKIQILFYSCIATLIALIDKAPLQLDERIGTTYIENGFYITYNGILNNTMEAPYTYRFIVPKIIHFLSEILNCSPINVAFILNIVCIFCVLSLFNKFAKTYLNSFESLLTTLVLSFFIAIIQCQIMGIIIIESQDIVNALFFIVLLLLAQKEKWLLFGLLLGFSITNRETTLILLLPFSSILYKQQKIKQLLWINFIGIGTYIIIRVLIKVKPSDYPNFANLKTNFPFLDISFLCKSLENNLHLFSLLLPIIILAFLNLKRQNYYTKSLILTIIPFIFIHYIMGTIIELRLFLPLIILILPIAIKNLKNNIEKQQNHNFQPKKRKRQASNS